MAIETQEVAVMNPGTYTGVIASGRETTTDFGDGFQKPVAEFEFVVEGYSPVALSFSPKLVYSTDGEPLSGLARFLEQTGLGRPKKGTKWVPSMAEGTPVRFEIKRNSKGFPNVVKESIKPGVK